MKIIHNLSQFQNIMDRQSLLDILLQYSPDIDVSQMDDVQLEMTVHDVCPFLFNDIEYKVAPPIPSYIEQLLPSSDWSTNVHSNSSINSSINLNHLPIVTKYPPGYKSNKFEMKTQYPLKVDEIIADFQPKAVIETVSAETPNNETVSTEISNNETVSAEIVNSQSTVDIPRYRLHSKINIRNLSEILNLIVSDKIVEARTILSKLCRGELLAIGDLNIETSPTLRDSLKNNIKAAQQIAQYWLSQLHESV